MNKRLAVISLSALLALAAWVVYKQWNLVDFDMPVEAWVALGFGVGLSMLAGVGLMALMFYSHRKGYDEPPQTERRD